MAVDVKTFAGLSLDRPRVMGVVNVTPDSFSDGGDAFNRDAAVVRGLRLAIEGADILDIGGESTRPGAVPVSVTEELDRVIPVIERLVGEGALVSVDTRHAPVMAEAVKAGAKIINDVSALTTDPDSLIVAANSGADVVMMHMAGTPETMQANPHYDDVIADIKSYLAGRIEAAVQAGIAAHKIAIDPGIGFGKSLDHNLALIKHLDAFQDLAVPVLLGVSRKSFIGKISGIDDPKQRLGGSLAAGLYGVAKGARILRVHDVAATVQAIALWTAIDQAGTVSAQS